MQKIALGFIGIVVFLILVVAACVSYIGTESGSNWALSKAQNILAKDFATELKFTSARLKVFSDLRFENLHVLSLYKGNRIEIQIPLIEMKYDIGLLARKISVEKFLIDHPNFDVEIENSNQVTNSEKAKSDPGEMIRKPPMKLEIRNFEISSMHLKFKSKDAVAEVNDLNLKSNLELVPDHFGLKADLKIARSNVHKEKLNLLWDLSSVVEIQVDHKNTWSYLLKTADLNLKLKQFEMGEIRFADLKLDSKTQFQASSDEFFKIEKANMSVAKQSTKLLMQQFSMNDIRFQQLVTDVEANLDKEVRMKWSSQVKKIESPGKMIGAPDAVFQAEAIISPDFEHMRANFSAILADVQIVSGQLTANKAKVFEVASQINFRADPRLAQKLKAAAILRQTGLFELSLASRAQISNETDITDETTVQIPQILFPGTKQKSSLKVDMNTKWVEKDRKADVRATTSFVNEELGSLLAKTTAVITLNETKGVTGTVEVSEVKAPAKKDFVVRLVEPIRMAFNVKSSDENLDADVKAEMSAVELPQLGTLRATQFDIVVKGDHMMTEKNIFLKSHITQNGVDLKQSPAGFKIASVKMNLEADVKKQTLFRIEHFDFLLNDGFVNISGNASGNLKTQDFQSQIAARLDFVPSLGEIMGQKLSGQIEVPINISLRNSTDLSVDGELNMKNVGVLKADMGVEGVSGRIPFSEHFVKHKGSLSFTELVTQNAFERVNFERLRPLLQSTDQITIQKIHWLEKVYGPLVGFVSIQQNMFFLHEFNLDLGSGGIYGEMFFNAYPRNLQFGLLSRVTALDLSEVLPQKFLKKIPRGDKKVSARTGFVFSINKAVINGRVDITEIGSPQLITMINILDPEFQDEKMNKVRSLLEIGYPTAVAMNFNQAYLDLDMDLSVLGMNQHQSVKSIPLSGFLIKPSSEIVSASQKGPLQ